MTTYRPNGHRQFRIVMIGEKPNRRGLYTYCVLSRTGETWQVGIHRDAPQRPLYHVGDVLNVPLLVQADPKTPGCRQVYLNWPVIGIVKAEEQPPPPQSIVQKLWEKTKQE